MDFYIATNGNDGWSGKLPAPNAKKTDGPFASFEGALNQIRHIKNIFCPNDKFYYKKQAVISEPITIWVRAGRYELKKPLVFSYHESYPLLFKAYKNEKPVISGGKKIQGWKESLLNGKRAWKAFIPEVKAGDWDFRSLFVNGKRARRPRLPADGFLTMEKVLDIKETKGGWDDGGQKTFIYYKGDLPGYLKYPDDIEVVLLHGWIEERSKASSVDQVSRKITMERPSLREMAGDSQLKNNPTNYYFDNVFEALGKEGEWFLDKKAGELIYLPKKGETLKKAEIIAPYLLQLVAFTGEPDKEKYIEFVGFEGLTFAHTDWRHPDFDGAQVLGSSNPRHTIGQTHSRRFMRCNLAGVAQASCDLPAVITFEGARQCKIENCCIENIGWYAIEIGDGCSNIKIAGNTIRDLGGGGVKINGTSAKDNMPLRESGSSSITDNFITEGGRIFHSAVAILSMHACKMLIAHNEISDFYYSGISCGWEWGYGKNITCDNFIEKNIIYKIGQKFLSDMGGIYILGLQPGTVVRRNIIFDVTSAKYGGWCIYLDEGSSHIIVEENLAYNADREIFNQHYGRENIVRNNIFAFGGEAVVRFARAEEHISATFHNNILISKGKPIFSKGYTRLMPRFLVMNNLIYDLKNKMPFVTTPEKEKVNWKEWQKIGNNTGSIIANPGLVIKGKKSFSLLNKSALKRLSINVPDFSDAGVRPAKLRN
jgi:hypothetical protein